jgi:hypothetical protein
VARIRTIKPEFPQSESMGNVSREARLLFILLWPFCDDHGKARGSSRLLASLLYPYDKDVPDLIDGWFDELVHERCVVRYEVEGAHYVKVTKWLEHQKIDRPSASKFPDPSEGSILIAKPREPSSGDQGSRTEGRDQGPGPAAPAKLREAAPDEPEPAKTPTVASAPPPAAATDEWPEMPERLRRPIAEVEILPPEQPTDVKAIIFGAGLRWLRKACGDVTESSCRSFLGQLIAQHGEVTTAACLMAAEKTNPVDPRGWMRRNIGVSNGQRPRNSGAVQRGSEAAQPDGISAAFARRSLQPGR